MKWSVLGERLFIFAAAVVLYWVAPQLQSWNLPSWVVTPLVGVVAVVAYQFLAAWGWFRPVRLLFDKRAKLIGQYVSKHTSGTTIAVFTIRLGFFDRKYRLNGDTYTTTPPILKDGNWWSDSLPDRRDASQVHLQRDQRWIGRRRLQCTCDRRSGPFHRRRGASDQDQFPLRETHPSCNSRCVEAPLVPLAQGTARDRGAAATFR